MVEQIMDAAVIGASRGTGLYLTEILAEKGWRVRAISRNPAPARSNVEPFSADITRPDEIKGALSGGFDAVFFTADITGGVGNRGLFSSADAVRAVTYGGCINAIDATRHSCPSARFILLSVMGVDQPSLLWSVLNVVKAGLKSITLEREHYLESSGLDYIILRAPTLTYRDTVVSALKATPPVHRLGIKLTLSRRNLANALARAATAAPARSTWDVLTEVPGRDTSSWLEHPI